MLGLPQPSGKGQRLASDTLRETRRDRHEPRRLPHVFGSDTYAAYGKKRVKPMDDRSPIGSARKSQSLLCDDPPPPWPEDPCWGPCLILISATVPVLFRWTLTSHPAWMLDSA